MDRIEIVKGPQSLLYGLSVLSGIANIIPKTPRDVAQYSFRTTIGSYDSFRVEFDATGPVGKDFSYRAFSAINHAGNRVDFRKSDSEYYGFQLQKYFFDKRLKLFSEMQYGRQKESGVGPRSVRDSFTQSNDTKIWNFRNDFGEFVDWQRDPNYGNKQNDRSYNLAGPDGYFERKEINVMLDSEFKPFKRADLWLKTGFLYGHQDIDERQVVVRTQHNTTGVYNIYDALRLAPASEISYNDVYNNPSVVTILLNPVPSGAGQLPQSLSYPISPLNAADVARSALSIRDDYKSMYYFFQKRPTEADNLQVRTELTYILRTPWLFSTDAKHSFLLGRLDIEDKVDYVSYPSGTDTFAQIYWGLEPGRFPPPFHTNPMQRKGVMDTTPIRYNGEPYPENGRSQQIKTWFTGHYFAYNGSLFNDRVNLILGVRRDTYQTWQGTYDRIGWRDTTYRPGNSTTQEDLLKQFNPDWDPFNPIVTIGEAETTGGFNGYNFNKRQQEDTKMGAISVRLNDNFSVYAMYGEGISPNTGLKDGNWNAIPAERTKSNELGLKFDLLDRRISGSVAFWRIRRENVIWETNFAPAPAGWVGGAFYKEQIDNGIGVTNSRIFDPTRRIDSPGVPVPGNPEVSYWVESRYLKELGISYARVPNPETRKFEYPLGILNVQGTTGVVPYTYILVEPSKLDPGSPLLQAMENAFNENFILPDGAAWDTQIGVPMFWDQFYDFGNNPGMSLLKTINVTMQDESRGVDFSLMATPVRDWQVVVNYSYIERRMTSPFQMVPVTSPASGENLGTIYDRWVYVLGRDSFSDPTDPTSYEDGMVGVSLFFSPNHSASIWSKHSFRDGRLKGFEIGYGAKYQSEAQTSIPMGGRDAVMNPYRTPPIPSRLTFDAMLAYDWTWSKSKWRIQLNLYNLTNDREGKNDVSYRVPEGQPNAGEEVRRRTERYYTPTTFRLSLGSTF